MYLFIIVFDTIMIVQNHFVMILHDTSFEYCDLKNMITRNQHQFLHIFGTGGTELQQKYKQKQNNFK